MFEKNVDGRYEETDEKMKRGKCNERARLRKGYERCKEVGREVDWETTARKRGGEAVMCTKEMKRAGLQRIGDWVQW